MMDRKMQFMEAVLGEDGAKALSKAVNRSEELGAVLVPRVILSWLKTTTDHSYEGYIPGVEDGYIRFSKSENGTFNGSLTIDNRLYKFEDASFYHLVASIAVSLGLRKDELQSRLRNVDLVRLGKNIDVLVKARGISKLLKAEPPGPPQPPTPPGEPKGPEEPEKQEGNKNAEKTPTSEGQGPGVKAPPKPKLNIPKLPKLNLSEKQMGTACEYCGQTQFRKNEFHGCLCFRDLAKSVETTKTDNGVSLQFGKEWNEEALGTLLETLGIE